MSMQVNDVSVAEEVRRIVGGLRQQVSRLAELTELAGRTNDVPALTEVVGLLRWLPGLKWELTRDRCVALTQSGQRCQLPAMRSVPATLHCGTHRLDINRSCPTCRARS